MKGDFQPMHDCEWKAKKNQRNIAQTLMHHIIGITLGPVVVGHTGALEWYTPWQPYGKWKWKLGKPWKIFFSPVISFIFAAPGKESMRTWEIIPPANLL